MKNSEKVLHPCFNEKCINSIKRLHLPIAPKCNIHCSFCNRQVSCTSLKKPGITKRILKSNEVEDYIKTVNKDSCIFGIAGPGEALFNAETFEVLNILKNYNTCLCTNGLLLEEKIDELIKLNLNYLSITINSLDYEIAAKIYDFVNYKGQIYKGIKGAELLINKQLSGLEKASKYDIRLKVNTVYIPGINDSQIIKISKLCKNYNVDIMNIIPVISDEFEPGDINDKVVKLRKEASKYIAQKEYCARCRADAFGYVDKEDEKIG